VLETLVLPIVADLQYEDSQAPRTGVTRVIIRYRTYVGLVKALGLHYLSHGRIAMPDTPLVRSIRWLLMIPVALGAATVVQYVVFQLAGMALYYAVGREGWGWTTWAAKCASTPFMGAIVVAVVWWLAPVRKSLATALAFGVVSLWGGVFVIGGVLSGGNWWLFAMGLSGFLGGALTWWLARRSIHGTAALA
jgi:hypothetical protein